MKQQVLERFIMVTGFERNPLYFLFTAAQDFHFPSGAASTQALLSVSCKIYRKTLFPQSSRPTKT